MADKRPIDQKLNDDTLAEDETKATEVMKEAILHPDQTKNMESFVGKIKQTDVRQRVIRQAQRVNESARRERMKENKKKLHPGTNEL